MSRNTTGAPEASTAAEAVADCGAALVLTDADLDHVLDAEPGPVPERLPSPGDTAYVLYTSGSTGNPKGVVVPHRALANFLLAMRTLVGSSPRDHWLALTSLSFDISALELYLPLVTGGRVVVAGAEDARDGGTLVTESFELPGSLPTRVYWLLLGWARGRTNEKGMLQTLERIRVVAERESHSPD